MIGIRLIISKLPHYKTSDIVEQTAQPHLIKYALYLVNRLRHIFYKKNRIRLQKVVRRAYKFR